MESNTPYTHTKQKTTAKLIDTKNRLVVARVGYGEVWGAGERVKGVKRYKLPIIK